ncbi:TetR/AcrR family transcriptional regulator [Frondihabitans cladoniiphilus]|uniref:HTH tetR-type domain-containing protein n=1 Tax=Frondihabitans cladoniiphilus TaxID=715785 RepID=A0ABP8WBU6_9MICO
MTTQAHESSTAAEVSSRERLLSSVADLILERGVGELSLSEVARFIGSNNRMLLYYFGSKEQLLNAACLVAFARFPHVEGMIDRLQRGPGTPRQRLEAAWRDIAHPDNRPFLALFFESFGIALHHPNRNRSFFEHIAASWVPEVQTVLVEAGIPSADAHLVATQIIATWRGLQFSLLLGTPREVLDAAYDAMIVSVLPAA